MISSNVSPFWGHYLSFLYPDRILPSLKNTLYTGIPRKDWPSSLLSKERYYKNTKKISIYAIFYKRMTGLLVRFFPGIAKVKVQ